MKLLQCHTDAYRRDLDTEVLSCVPAGERFVVELAESVLYPGGGGQPVDHGTIGAAQVLDAEVSDDAVRYVVDRAIEPGPARIELDWARRFDHMQQHSAQHLISAIAWREFGWQTIAFHLNPERCDVVLDAVPDAAGIAALEERVNAAIREARPVFPREIAPDRLEEEGVRSRLLPPGHVGPLRVIEIDGYDLNTCGGTHVSNTAHLQMVRFIGLDAQKGQGRLHWLAGDRLRADAAASQRRAEALTRSLRRSPAEHVAVVDGLLAEVKRGRKAVDAVRRELATHLGAALARTEAPVAALHRDAGDLGFLGAIAAAAHAERAELLLILTAGDREGVFLVAGPGAGDVGPAIAEVLAGRGGGRGRRYQGKATRVDRHREAVDAAMGGVDGGG